MEILERLKKRREEMAKNHVQVQMQGTGPAMAHLSLALLDAFNAGEVVAFSVDERGGKCPRFLVTMFDVSPPAYEGDFVNVDALLELLR